MENIFDKLGFASPEAGIGTLFILVVILFVICIALIIGVITLLVRKKDFSDNITGVKKQRAKTGAVKTGGKISSEKLQMLALNQRDLTTNIDDLYRKVGKSYQKVGIVKYNAYSNMSGNVSFAIAMLDGDNSGFILNVINGREGSNLYIKDIEKAQSKERLGAEEVQALKNAVSQ